MDNPESPKWLKELQLKSWEPEILLSGIVLYGMFNMPDLLNRGLIYFSSNVYGQTTDIENLVAVLKLATYWLIAGLVLHLISRGIWVGMVGLSYTFPNGIRADKLNYKGKFKEKIKNIPRFEKIIMNLEKICSSLFSVSFMMFMMMIGAYLYLFIRALIPFFIILGLTNDWNSLPMQIFQYYTLLVVLTGIVGIIDFVTLGYFRRFKWIAKIYWPLHRFISIFTLSRYYRGIYYGLVSNINKWYLFVGVFIFTAFNLVIFDNVNTTHYQGISFSRISLWHSVGGYSAFNGYYDDQNEDVYSVRASIPSDIIDENTLRLFIVANINLEDSIIAYTDYKEAPEAIDSLEGANRSLAMVKSFYHIYLNDSLLSGYPMKFHYKAHTRQMGYLVYLDITEMASGLHELKIAGPPEMYNEGYFAEIPFYRERRDILIPDEDDVGSGEDRVGVRSVKPLIVD